MRTNFIVAAIVLAAIRFLAGVLSGNPAAALWAATTAVALIAFLGARRPVNYVVITHEHVDEREVANFISTHLQQHDKNGPHA